MERGHPGCIRGTVAQGDVLGTEGEAASGTGNLPGGGRRERLPRRGAQGHLAPFTGSSKRVAAAATSASAPSGGSSWPALPCGWSGRTWAAPGTSLLRARWKPRGLPGPFPADFRTLPLLPRAGRGRRAGGGRSAGRGRRGGEGRSGFWRLLPWRHPQDVLFQVPSPLLFGRP